MTQVWDMVEERALQLAPPPGVAALDPLMQLQQNLAALNQVNQAIGEFTSNCIQRVFPSVCQKLFAYEDPVILFLYFQRPIL